MRRRSGGVGFVLAAAGTALVGRLGQFVLAILLLPAVWNWLAGPLLPSVPPMTYVMSVCVVGLAVVFPKRG